MTYPPPGGFPDSVDVVLGDDTGTDPDGGREPAYYLVSAAAPCRINEFSASRDGMPAALVGDREEVRRTYVVNFPSDHRLTAAHCLVWVRPEDSRACWLRVRHAERSPDGGRWLPWSVLCELDESSEPPLTSAAGLTPYTPPA